MATRTTRRLTIAFVALAACGDAGIRVETTDSAGIRLIENPPVRDVRGTVSLVDPPRTVLGGVRDDLREEFLGRSGYYTAVRMSNGRIFAHDRDHVKHFDAEGRLVGVIGREGDGPGEFRNIYGLCRFRGDSLVVADQQRVMIVSPAGQIVRQYAPAGGVVGNTCFDDGAVLVGVNDGARVPGVTNFLIISSVGDTLGRLRGMATSVYAPVWREVSYAIHRDELYVGDALEMAVRVYDRAGVLRRIVRTRDVAEPAAIDDPPFEAAAGSGASRTAAPAPPPGATQPMYSIMAVDGRGRIWLRTREHRGADVTWVAFGDDGALTGRLTMIDDVESLPPRTVPWDGRRILRFGVDEVIVLDRDDSGAFRLSFHGLAVPP